MEANQPGFKVYFGMYVLLGLLVLYFLGAAGAFDVLRPEPVLFPWSTVALLVGLALFRNPGPACLTSLSFCAGFVFAVDAVRRKVTRKTFLICFVITHLVLTALSMLVLLR